MTGTSWIPDEHRTERLIPLVLAALSIVAVVLSIEPFPVGVFQDDGIYTVLAKSLATGQGFRYLQMPDAPNATHFPPVYPFFLAGLWKLFPSFPANVTVFKFANAGFIALTAVMAWRFARRNLGMGQWSAAITVGASTACAQVVFLSVMVMSEPMFLAALFPVLMACDRAAKSGSTRDALVAGAAGGALALIRTLGVVAIPATVLVLAWRRRWLAAALVIVAGALVMLPWQLWIAAHDAEVPAVLMGKYGSYSGWLWEGMREGGVAWVFQLALFNLRTFVGGGWETLGVELLPSPVRWLATLVVTACFTAGWWQMLRRVPVAAWMVAGYMALVIMWPFPPQRFTFGIWPLLGLHFGLAIESIVKWRPQLRSQVAVRWVGVGFASLLVLGYARSNYSSFVNGWWTQVQAYVADRAKPMAEWVSTSTNEHDIIATEDDVMIHLYTGRLAVPLGTFTPRDHMTAQTPEFAAQALRTILQTYDLDYVLATTPFGARAAQSLVLAAPPGLSFMGALKLGAIYQPLPKADTP
jgi:Dolichyl-phosphate-mannose-protein mannosyltransferase